MQNNARVYVVPVEDSLALPHVLSYLPSLEINSAHISGREFVEERVRWLLKLLPEYSPLRKFASSREGTG